MHKKIEQLIKVADAMVEGSLNDLPKNLTNFKLVLESVKMALEIDKEKILNNPLFKAGLEEPEKEIVAEVIAPKRKRRTKEEMLRDAAIKAKELEIKIDGATAKIEAAGVELDTEPEKVETIVNSVTKAIKAKEVNTGEKEDWEKEVVITPEPIVEEKEKLVPTDILPWNEDGVELETKEFKITELITKYPDPLNLSLLEGRAEKVALVADMNTIKDLVGNTNTADIKECLTKLNLDNGITIRAYKFLMVLPHLETDLK